MTFFKRIAVLILALFALFGFAACKDKIDPETKIKEALQSIALGDTNSITDSFDLISETGKHMLPITWSIENIELETAELDLTGDVPRVIITQDPYTEDEEGKPTNNWGHAKLRATVSVGDKSSYREWDLWIKPADKIIMMSVAEAAAESEGATVGVEGTVTYIHGGGFYVQDDTGAIYVYGKPASGKLPENLKPGAKVKVEGKITIYYGQPEIDKEYKMQVLEAAPETGFDYASVAVDAFVPEITWLSANDRTAYGRILNISGKVTKSQYGDYDNYEITDELTGEKVMIYHDSENGFMDAIEANFEQYVKATVITYNYHSSDKVWRVFGYAGSVTKTDAVEYADEDKIHLISLKLESAFDNIEVVSDLNLPTQYLFDSTIAWESSAPTVIGNDGKFTVPTEDTEVELTASVTIGETTLEFTFEVTAVAPTKLTVAELLEAIDNEEANNVLVEGVIIGRDSGGYFYLADETAVVYTRVKLSDHNVEVGDKVRVIANGSIYNGTTRYNRQFAGDGNAVIEKVDDEKHESPLEAVQAEISDFDHTITVDNLVEKVQEEELFGKVFEISGYFVLVPSGSFTDLYLAESLEEGADKVRIYHSSMEVNALKELAGKQVTITAVVYEVYPSTGLWNLGFMGREGDLEVTLTNEDLEEIAEKEINAILPEDNVLVGDLNFFNKTKHTYVLGDVTYQFVSNNTDVLDAEGKFTAPDAEVTVELTVTVTFSAEHTKVFEFDLTAKPEEAPEDPSLKYHFDFEVGGATSYNDATTEFTNLVNNSKVEIVSHRVAYNKTGSVDGATRGMVISPRKGGSDDETAWAELNFGTDVITAMTFDCYFWNSSAEQYFTKFELQVKVGDEWTTVKDLLAEIAGKTTINQITLEGLSGSVFRFYAEGGKNGGNDARVIIDNFKAHIDFNE